VTYPQPDYDGSVNQVPGVTFLRRVLSGEVNAPPNLADFAHILADHLASHLRELVFEDVRRREFPTCHPARCACGSYQIRMA
jgi:hypothetical protein